MIPTEVIYAVIGAVGALIAGRLGIPLPGLTRPAAPSGNLLRTAVRAALLEVLRGLTKPEPDDGAEIVRHLKDLAHQGQG
jgi:hypothetical protein